MARSQKLPFDLTALCQAIQQSRLTLRRPREERTYAVRQYVGKHYSEEAARQMVPVNLLGLYVSIMSRSLVAKNPRVMLSTFEREMKPVVSAMESWANEEIENIQLANTLERAVVDALFNIGIVKVGLATPADAALLNWDLRAGQPFAERVDLDDFVYDIHARDFSEAGYLGHRVRLPLQALKSWLKSKKQLQDLAGQEDEFFNHEGDERVSMIGRGYYSNREEYEAMVDVWEIYLPRHKLVLTLLDQHLSGPNEQGDASPLHVQRWLGPPHGPYHILGFGIVPGNCMPKAPVMDLIDLHEAVNQCYRKVFRTVGRLKEVTAYRDGADRDGKAALEASDGDAIAVTDPQNLVQIVFSGTTLQTLLLVAPHLRDLFNWLAGNIEAMAGLSPQAKTLGQDELLQAGASKTMQDMQDRCLGLATSVIKSLCWYWHHDPFKVMHSEYQIQGLPGMGIKRSVAPKQRRQGRFEDLKVLVDPYSMQHQTPQTRMAQINQVVTQVIIPMMQLLVQSGHSFDVQAYLQKLSKYMSMPDLADIITIQEPPQPDGGSGPAGGSEMGPQPAQTERKYTRENVASRTRQGDDLNLMNAVRGVNPGGAAETANRP